MLSTSKQILPFGRYLLTALLTLSSLLANTVPGQEPQTDEQSETSDVEVADEVQKTEIDQKQRPKRVRSGHTTIIVEGSTEPKELPDFYSVKTRASVWIDQELVSHDIEITAKLIQGKPEVLVLGINGWGEVANVESEQLLAWSVRREGGNRFLDLRLKDDAVEFAGRISSITKLPSLPIDVELLHLSPGDAIAFDSDLTLSTSPEVQFTVADVDGFSPVLNEGRMERFHSTTGGKLALKIGRKGVPQAAVTIEDARLEGVVDETGKSIAFQLIGTAVVTKPNASLQVLSGNVAVTTIPSSDNHRLKLSKKENDYAYQVDFPSAGEFPLQVDFAAPITTTENDLNGVDFVIATGAVMPLSIEGLSTDLQFIGTEKAIVPELQQDQWTGFLPASGNVILRWKTARKTGEGKLFFTTNAQIETQIGAGLLKQTHQLDYQVLQGELDTLRLALSGPGEILDIQGTDILGWKVLSEDDQRILEITLSQPIRNTSRLIVRSQTALDEFPVRVEGLRLTPQETIRHSGYLRLTNLGSIRLEPVELSGLTQLSPEQFPAEPIEARQTFVYRFPSSDYGFSVSADRIQPEINVSTLTRYEVAEADRVINADIELDIREAAIREWEFSIPEDYSIVSATGASVVDYLAGSEITDAHRSLKIFFGQEIIGRQLISLTLEKNEPAAAGQWQLPKLLFPSVKSTRGDIGIVGAAGIRISIADTTELVERPLAYFAKSTPGLQQAFRIRQADWAATANIELLQRNVQSDVFHLYSLSQQTIYGSALVNYFVTGAPVSQWKLTVPEELGNLMVEGQDVRTWRRDGSTLYVTLHQPVMGAYTLLVTFEEKADRDQGQFSAGSVAPLEVEGERGYVQVVSPMQVDLETVAASDDLLALDPLELPAEFRLLSTAPALGTWQYTERPFQLQLNVDWFQPGATVPQIVEFSEAQSHVSQDGELVTDVLYYVKSRGQRSLRVQLPPEPVRLWQVSVNNEIVTARQAENATLIPLPGGTDPNVPVEVRLRLGKPSVDQQRPELALPIIDAPVLKTQWVVRGDENRVLIASGGNVRPPRPTTRQIGFNWVARSGLPALALTAFFAILGWSALRRSTPWQVVGIISTAVAIVVASITSGIAWMDLEAPQAIELSIPVLSIGESASLLVDNLPAWRVDISWIGIVLVAIGLFLVLVPVVGQRMKRRGQTQTETPTGKLATLPYLLGFVSISFGILLNGGSAPLFFGVIAVLLALALIKPILRLVGATFHTAKELVKSSRKKSSAIPIVEGSAPLLLFFIGLLVASQQSPSVANDTASLIRADVIQQVWEVDHQKSRLSATATLELTGRPGDSAMLLQASAILTDFKSDSLSVTKTTLQEGSSAYVVSIPIDSDDDSVSQHKATFEYQIEQVNPLAGITIPTGIAGIQRITVTSNQSGWEVTSPSVVRIKPTDSADETKAEILLQPRPGVIFVRPKARDVSTEKSMFYVEGSQVYMPGPGVVNGVHQFQIRTSQGQLSQLVIDVPDELTVSDVAGPVQSWQFDADARKLNIELQPPQATTFQLTIQTQRGLGALPAEVTVKPLVVENANGQVGLIALGFGQDAQPEKIEADQLSAVNLSDFRHDLMPSTDITLHRVYRYTGDAGAASIAVAPVQPEVRVQSKQVLSFGDERIVFGINLAVEITRSGVFKLSFPLPSGFEVESLSGPALHHWSEVNESDTRTIVMHLNGKTIGVQSFTATLTAATPTDVDQWQAPAFILNESTRQTGEFVVRPTTGIRLRTITRENVSETDPRSLGGLGQGNLAYRILQRDWSLQLGIEKLAPWVTGQVLHEITLREGQTRATLLANMEVQNASVRSIMIELPGLVEDEIKTLRATGEAVSDFIRSTANSDRWELQFKRRIVGKVQFQIEYERRGDRQGNVETLRPIQFPESKQLTCYAAIRAGGRLELSPQALPTGWQRIDWNSVPTAIRNAGNRNAPALAFRSVGASQPLTISIQRHSLAEALKLRVAEGNLTTVLASTGNQLTSVELTMDVIQRSSMTIKIPGEGTLFNVFVNGESVNSIRLGEASDTWQFYVLPGINDRSATVRFTYSAAGNGVSNLTLVSPTLNVPLENIQWNVVAPKGFELTDNDGDLELIELDYRDEYDRGSYLSKMNRRRETQAEQASKLLEQANELLMKGEQSKATWALNSVANQYALDAASNEDARVQLENLQRQQAIVGLNTRRQRLYLDNRPVDSDFDDNKQLRDAAAINPILLQNELNFRPQQLTELLQGNTSEDNAVLGQIASRLVQHQHGTEPAPQAITISLPEEGTVYRFTRAVQVSENAPLQLQLQLTRVWRVEWWQTAITIALLTLLAAACTWTAVLKPKVGSAIEI
ncbi:hypothetical protein ACMFWY_22410 [Roseiconus sp. JC912]